MVDSKQPLAKNQLLVVCTLILIALYKLHKNLVWFTPYHEDASEFATAGHFVIMNCNN